MNSLWTAGNPGTDRHDRREEAASRTLITPIKGYEERQREGKDRPRSGSSMRMTSHGIWRKYLPLGASDAARDLAMASTTMKSIKEEILALIQKVAEGLAVLNEVDSPYTRDMKEVFLNTYDIGAAMAERNRLEAAEQNGKNTKPRWPEEKRNRKPEERQRPRRWRLPEEKWRRRNWHQRRKQAIETVQDPVYAVDFRVHATEKQLDDLKHFLRSNGIRFEPVPKQ